MGKFEVPVGLAQHTLKEIKAILWKTFFVGVVVFKKVMFSENKSLFSENKSLFSENKRYMLQLTEDSGPFSGSSKMMVS